MPAYASYAFLEAALVATVFLVTLDSFQVRVLFQRQFLVRAGLLFLLWFLVDQVALSIGVWYFPAEGTIPVRLARLPLEEYALFIIHTVICQMLIAEKPR